MAVKRLVVAATLLAACGGVLADDKRAHLNYMLHCQGCHLPQTEGFPGKVPPMKDFVGYFLHSREGREFLIRVPGVAQSALTDAEVADLMNWIVVTYSANQLPSDFEPFTSAEVAVLRVSPVGDPAKRRTEILAGIASRLPALADELEAGR